MCKLIFTRQQKEFDLDAKRLSDFVSAFPATVKYREIFESIFLLALPECVIEIIRRKRLSQCGILRCFANADSSIRSKLLSIPEFIEFLDQEELSSPLMADAYGADLDKYESKLQLFNFIPDSAYKEAVSTIFLGEKSTPGILTLVNRFSDFTAARFIWDFAEYKQNPFNEYNLQMAQGKQEKIFLKIKDKEFLCNLEILLCFSQYCITEDEENSSLVQAFINIGHPLLTASLIWTELIDLETIDNLWNSGSILICRELVERGYFLNTISDNQVKEIIAAADFQMLRTLAYNIYILYKDWEDIQKTGRLSKEIRDELLLFIIEQKDKSFFKGLLTNINSFPRPYKKLIKRCQKELSAE